MPERITLGEYAALQLEGRESLASFLQRIINQFGEDIPLSEEVISFLGSYEGTRWQKAEALRLICSGRGNGK